MKKLFQFTFLLILYSSAFATIIPTHLRCEYLTNPPVIGLGPDLPHARLSWINIAGPGERGQMQTSYEIRVASTMRKLTNNQADLWFSGKVKSDQSTNFYYQGKPLISRLDYWWPVMTWDKDGKVSGWSEPASWSMGLLQIGRVGFRKVFI